MAYVHRVYPTSGPARSMALADGASAATEPAGLRLEHAGGARVGDAAHVPLPELLEVDLAAAVGVDLVKPVPRHALEPTAALRRRRHAPQRQHAGLKLLHVRVLSIWYAELGWEEVCAMHVCASHCGVLRLVLQASS